MNTSCTCGCQANDHEIDGEELRECGECACVQYESLAKLLRDSQDQATHLRTALASAIDLAEEGWSYASDYYRKKWEYDDGITKLREALGDHANVVSHPMADGSSGPTTGSVHETDTCEGCGAELGVEDPGEYDSAEDGPFCAECIEACTDEATEETP